MNVSDIIEKMVGQDEFSFKRSCMSLAGDGNTVLRCAIMKELTGVSHSKSRCRISDIEFEIRKKRKP